MRIRRRQLYLSVWKYEVLLLWGGTIGQAERIVSKHFKSDRITTDREEPKGRTWWDDRYAPVVWVKDRSPQILAHEFLHVVMAIMRSRGVKPKSEEPFCYTLECLMRQACYDLKITEPRRKR